MNKIIHRFQIIAVFVVIFLLTSLKTACQDSIANKYGLKVIASAKVLQKMVFKNPANIMIDLKKQIPQLVFDLRYATNNNFTYEKLYPGITTSYLRKPAADSLLAIENELNKMGLGLKIFDAYRPYSVTEKMWAIVPDDRYAANPKYGSGHNRGAAVDVTLINMQTGNELNMGTGFDNFTDTAHHSFTNLPEEILQNRLLLKKIMAHHGFKALDTEWWHYSIFDAADFELLDISFKNLEKKNKNIRK